MVNINAQEYINQKYPIEGVCKRDNDPENKGKKREEVTILDISQGKVGSNYFSDGKTLVGSLKLERFTNLRTLIVSSHQLISLDLSDCPNLEELNCQNNELTNLNVINCSNLKKINCSNNNIERLDLGACTKLEEVNINNCPNLTEEAIKSHLTYDVEKGKLAKGSAKSSPQIRKVGEDDIRNILIVGITGNGKSALANALSDKYGSNEFGEGNFSISVTKNFQKSEVFQ